MDIDKILNSVANMTGMIGAASSRDPRAVRNTAASIEDVRGRRYDQNLLEFGDEVFGAMRAGQKVTPEMITASAQSKGIKPQDAMKLITNFTKARAYESTARQEKAEQEFLAEKKEFMKGYTPGQPGFDEKKWRAEGARREFLDLPKLDTAKEPKLERVDTMEDGQAVTKFVTAASGDTYPKIPKPQGGKDRSPTPSQGIAQLKLDAWKAYYDGVATQQQRRLIKVDTDPYIAKAAQMVVDDRKLFNATSEEKAKRTVELANTMREATDRQYKKGSNPNWDWETLWGG